MVTSIFRPDIILLFFYSRILGDGLAITYFFKKDADVNENWSNIHDQAMVDLKKQLITAQVVVCDDGTSQLELQTDTSVKGIGVVLILNKNGESTPITKELGWC
jgi:hypothetical protein